MGHVSIVRIAPSELVHSLVDELTYRGGSVTTNALSYSSTYEMGGHADALEMPTEGQATCQGAGSTQRSLSYSPLVPLRILLTGEIVGRSRYSKSRVQRSLSLTHLPPGSSKRTTRVPGQILQRLSSRNTCTANKATNTSTCCFANIFHDPSGKIPPLEALTGPLSDRRIDHLQVARLTACTSKSPHSCHRACSDKPALHRSLEPLPLRSLTALIPRPDSGSGNAPCSRKGVTYYRKGSLTESLVERLAGSP